MKIPDFVRHLNKKYINRAMIRIAGKRHSPFAVLCHTGRRTGNQYEIPILPAARTDRFIFALTYGDDVDWYRNVLASGNCRLVWHGRQYYLVAPLKLPAQVGQSLFPQPFRTILTLIGIEGYVQMTIVP